MKKLIAFIAISVLVVFIGVIYTPLDQAQTAPHSNVAKVSFTFDDGYESTLKNAATTLQRYNLKGTLYIPTGCINNTGDCRKNVNATAAYLTWSQIRQLQDVYGWEIASHTQNHKRLSELHTAQKVEEIKGAKDDLAKQGFNSVNFASPEGDYDYASLAIVSKYYVSHRGFWDQNVNRWPYNDNILNVVQVQSGVSIAEVKDKIDQAIHNKQWLILVFHDIKENASTHAIDYEYETADLAAIAAYVQKKQQEGSLQNVTISEVLGHGDGNLIVNGTFANGLSNGWKTDNEKNVTKDTHDNGQFPSAVDSIKINGSAKDTHLYAPPIVANSKASYIFKAYVNTLNKTAGEFGFYIDEYDRNGKWISGKWLGAVWLPTVSHFTANYTPTSKNVVTFKIQTYFSGNAKGFVYIDNYQLYAENQAHAQPTQTQIPKHAQVLGETSAR